MKNVPDASVLAAHAEAIRALGKRVVAEVIEIGRRLSECKERLKEERRWLAWLKDEFAWSRQTSDNFINVYEMGLKVPTVGTFDLDMRSLYLLAAPSTPDEARDEVFERAKAGEPVSVAEIKRTVDHAKGQQPARKTPQRLPKGRAMLHRRSKLGDELVDKIKGTSLDRAEEMDELVVLNRGAAPGEHTDCVKKLVAAAVAGMPVSACAYSAEIHLPPDIGPNSASEGERLNARIAELENQKRLLQIKIAGLESEIDELKAQLAAAPPTAPVATGKTVGPLDLRETLRPGLPNFTVSERAGSASS